MPATLEGVKRYLGSGLIKGIGPVMAERIVDQFGDETLDVIEYETGRLEDVSGIGKKRIGMIVDAWEQQKAIKDVMIFLQSHNVSTRLATKIYKKYEDESLEIVQQEGVIVTYPDKTPFAEKVESLMESYQDNEKIYDLITRIRAVE